MKNFILLMAFILVLGLSGCSNGAENVNDSTESIDTTEDGNVAEKQEPGYYKFNETFLIGYGFEMILKPDGTVIARGRNNNGELGNGTLKDSETWATVEGLSDVKQIACGGNGESTTIFALKNDGTVWWWGGEQVHPIPIENLSNIERLSSKNRGSGDSESVCYTYAHNRDKAMMRLFSGGYEEECDGIPMDDHVSIYEDWGKGLDYYILDGNLYRYDSGQSEQIAGIENVKTMYEYYDNMDYLLTEEGSVFYYDNYKEEAWISSGGNGIEKIYIISGRNSYYYSFTYFRSGTIFTRGDNLYGEVGNGTAEPYESQSWEVDLPTLSDAFSSLNGKAFAIDTENNLWAWGIGYTYDPEIQYNLDDIVSGQF